jgi:uridine kinase
VSRLPVLERLAAGVAELPLPARVAIDGVDAAGKTTLANELAARLPGAARLGADDFLRPPEERYRRGRESPEGYYEDSFDHGRLREAVLSADGLLLVDGIFLLRPQLADLWDFTIFVHVEPETAIRRGIARDGAETERLYGRRYGPGQKLYLDAVRPAERADVVVDNTDPERPRFSRDGGGGRWS